MDCLLMKAMESMSPMLMVSIGMPGTAITIRLNGQRWKFEEGILRWVLSNLHNLLQCLKNAVIIFNFSIMDLDISCQW